MPGPTVDFWQARFDTGQTGWDRGAASPQLLAWLDQGVLQPCRIAVPGCGRGWEVAELAARGFEVVGLDYTAAALEASRALLQSRGLQADLQQVDVLDHAPTTPYDAIYEQTCLCALHPEHWRAYADRMHGWLAPGGRLAALLMQMPRAEAVEQGQIQGPPYHVDINAARALLPESRWQWPRPPYGRVPHPGGMHELAAVLVRR